MLFLAVAFIQFTTALPQDYKNNQNTQVSADGKTEKIPQKDEVSYYLEVEKKSKISGYLSYLDLYPNGKYVASAYHGIAKQKLADNKVDEAIKLFSRAANLNHKKSQFQLGMIYFEGKQINQNYNKSIYWFNKAATNNLSAAQFMLGMIYLNGIGTEKDKPKALKWLLMASKNGRAEAQHVLGSIYYLGEIVSKDINHALTWLEKAANQGYSKSQYLLGLIYSSGEESVEIDYKKAIEWLLKSEKQGNIQALTLIGKIYIIGEGEYRNPSKGQEILERAAKLGDEEAKKTLIMIYGIDE